MANSSSAARNKFFKELKPRCVRINDLTVRSSDPRESARDLLNVTEDLSALLDHQVSQDASVLDEKLADYVFFPLSNILRNQQQYPIRLTEVTIKCFRILVDYGWKSKLPKELAQQLLLLLTFIIAGAPGQEKRALIPEETELESFKALTSLLKALGSSSTGAVALAEAETIPALGHAITVLLDGVSNGRTPIIQLEALQALNALVVAIKDQAALATFLPGITSSLSRLLSPPEASKTQRKVLVKGIDTLRIVLTKVLGDLNVRGILKRPANDAANEEVDGKVLTDSWLTATVNKVKLALASVLRIRGHSSEDVRTALRKLCVTLLDECHHSLSDASLILVETAMILGGENCREAIDETGLADLARIYPELGDDIKTTVYNWVTSLPRIVQSSEERIKQQAMRNLLEGQHFIASLHIDSPILDDSLAASLRDSATALVIGSKSGSVLSELPSTSPELGSMAVSSQYEMVPFQPVLIASETERPTLVAFIDLISKIGPQPQRIRLASEMMNYVREYDGPSQVTSYWVAFELVKSTLIEASELDDFLDFSAVEDTSNDSESTLQELYTFSVAVLGSQAEAEGVDWRMQALALEITTFVAYRMRDGFRPELIDVLYPIATFLGSDIPQLRQHAILSLNGIAAACGYPNVTDLIIDNVDYMLNSVSLRLNSFDISPASTRVLGMMIKLTGPRLVPYLDDVVASIFAALDNYHGYTLFVDSLFRVLAEIVQQGTRSSNLLLEDTPKSINHKKTPAAVVTTDDLCGILDKRHERQRKRDQERLEWKRLESHPERPFKASDITGTADEGGAEEDEGATDAEAEKPPPPKTRTFQLLARITSLTQHYLTSPAPALRKSLLNLLATVCPALAPEEDDFLPLVNAVWPVLMERLYDPEAFVAVAASEALCALCAAAGDFLAARFKTEWWDNGLGKWCRKIKTEALRLQGRGKDTGRRNLGTTTARLLLGGDSPQDNEIIIPTRAALGQLEVGDISKGLARSARGGNTINNTGLGLYAQAAQVWDAVQALLIAIVTYVCIDDDIFDQILELLSDALESENSEARTALEAADADAVWLFMYERGMVALEPDFHPVMAGMEFVKV